MARKKKPKERPTSVEDTQTVQPARIALLEHYTSQMQSYKTAVLTLFIGFFAGVEAIRLLQLPSALALYLISLGSGTLPGGIFYCLARVGWYGKLAWCSLSAVPVPVCDAPQPLPMDANTLLFRLSQGADRLLQAQQENRDLIRAQQERKDFIRARWQRLVRLGDTERTLELFLYAVIIALSWAIAEYSVCILALVWKWM